ncbi:MAG TPA: acetylxylan esterase [Terracidiphilus sp.]|nr:acetylxylan esterase [Terracidiphilus sp.]
MGDDIVRNVRVEASRISALSLESFRGLFLALATSCFILCGTVLVGLGQSTVNGQEAAPRATPWSPGNVKSFVLKGPNGEPIPINYDESKADNYTLPDPLKLERGKEVRTASAWYHERRPQLLHLFEEDVYGRTPARPDPYGIRYKVFNVDHNALGGIALREQVEIYFKRDETGPKMDMVIYLPAHSDGPVPLFLCLSFSGVNAIAGDSGVQIKEIWNTREKIKVPAWPLRNATSDKWPVAKILAQGYGLAVICYNDIEPDFIGGYQYSVRRLFAKSGQTEQDRAPDAWGAIGAWAWGLSRAMDYLETDKAVNAKQVALVGQSRLGKTVLWAGAEDIRFAMVIDSCSGKAGASLLRHNYGETIKNLVLHWPYQFAPNFRKFMDDPDKLPVDSNELIALIAPRPVFLSTGSLDQWSDPRGTFLAAVAAGPVFQLLGVEGLGTNQFPPLDHPIMHTIGFDSHSEGHEITEADWDRFLEFAGMHFTSER